MYETVSRGTVHSRTAHFDFPYKQLLGSHLSVRSTYFEVHPSPLDTEGLGVVGVGGEILVVAHVSAMARGLRLHVPILVYTYVYMCIYIYIHIHTYMYIYIHVYI